MATLHYQKTIKNIQDYYGVSNECAKFLYHRAIRSTRKDDNYLKWTIQLQNALVKADKCLGVNWNKILFDKEDEILPLYGLHVDEMEPTTFRWNSDVDEVDSSEADWTKIVHKKNKRRRYNFTFTGLLL